MNRKRFVMTWIALLALLLTAGGATGQDPDPEGEASPRAEASIAGTVNSRISYQGRLLEDDTPVTGSRDLLFRLYSDSSCTAQVGSDIVKNSVPVTDGLFSVELDVSHWSFNGQGLWLEVHVGATVMGCQEILPVPYALSLRPGARIDDLASTLYLNRYRTSPAPFFDTHKYGLHAVADGNYDFAYGVSGVAHSSRLGGEAYGLYGSASATGTSGTAYGVYGMTGNTDPPSAGVYGQGGHYGVSGEGIAFGVNGEGTIAGVRGYNDSGHGIMGIAADTSGEHYGVWGSSASSTTASAGVFGKSHATSGETYGVRGESASSTAGSAGVFGKATAPSGQVHGVRGWTDSTTDGSAGVAGRADASSGQVYGVHGRSDSAAGAGVYGYAPGQGVWGTSASSGGIGVRGTNTSFDPGGIGVSGSSYYGIGVQGLGGNGVGVKGEGNGFAAVEARNYSDGHGVYAETDGPGEGGTAVYAQANDPGGIALWGNSDSDDATLVLRNDGSGDLIRGFSHGDWEFRFRVENDGRTTVPVLEITGGIDLAEQFDVAAASGEVTPGLVVCIDVDHPGRLVVCTQAYDRTVAGVVSGAGGIEPGMVLGQEGSPADGDYPVALTGRVYVWADATAGPIRPGDLLTTSATPGYVMAVSDYGRAQGAVIGKAMSSLDEGVGLILVLVSLQ
jgi:hypothetical protein